MQSNREDFIKCKKPCTVSARTVHRGVLQKSHLPTYPHVCRSLEDRPISSSKQTFHCHKNYSTDSPFCDDHGISFSWLHCPSLSSRIAKKLLQTGDTWNLDDLWMVTHCGQRHDATLSHIGHLQKKTHVAILGN